MSEAPLHRLYSHYSELPASLRILYTAALCVLGAGYLFGLIYVFHVNSGRDGNAMNLSYDDIVIAYAGNGKVSKLESALRGPMSTMLPPEEAKGLLNWVRSGAERAPYDASAKAILDTRCLSCHNGSNPHSLNLSGYDNVKVTTVQDTGADIFTLVRVSHIHLFGITFVFFLVGLIFSHAYVRPVWFKCALMGAPFVCLFIDVISWYLVKIYHPFAWATMGAGGLMGLSFAIMWGISIYQMWLSRTPKAIVDRSEQSRKIIG